MHTRHHILTGLAATLVAYPFVGLNALIILAASILPDADHYLIYVWRKRDLSIRRAYKYCASIKDASTLFLPLHYVEWLIIMLFASLYYDFVFLVMIGFLLHIILDIFYEKFVKSTRRGFSLFDFIIRTRLKKTAA